MHLVAIAEIGHALETPKLNAVAAAIDMMAYELRLLLNAGQPSVVRVTADEAQAHATYAALTAQGLKAVRCDSSKTVSSAAMTTLRHFETTVSALVPDQGSQESCAYSDIVVLLRAIHRATHESIETVQTRKFQPVMALATGGMVMSKKTSQDVTTTTSSREQVLYIFRSGGVRPWILRERTASYSSLGAAMGPSSFDNFNKTIERLRSLAPGAVYDDRLMTSRPIRGIGEGSASTDLLAYLLAAHLSPRQL